MIEHLRRTNAALEQEAKEETDRHAVRPSCGCLCCKQLPLLLISLLLMWLPLHLLLPLKRWRWRCVRVRLCLRCEVCCP